MNKFRWTIDLYDIDEKQCYPVLSNTLYKIIININHKAKNSNFIISGECLTISPQLVLDKDIESNIIIKKSECNMYKIEQYIVYCYTYKLSRIYIYSNGIYFDNIEFKKVCTDVICNGKGAERFNNVYKRENILNTKSPILKSYYSELYNIINSECVRI